MGTSTDEAGKQQINDAAELCDQPETLSHLKPNIIIFIEG